MRDYIRKDDVLALIEKYRIELPSTYSAGLTTAKNAVKGMPTEDIVPRAEIAREIFEELSMEIMPLVESHNKLAENTGDREWGYRADGLETALIALKGIIRKYGVME